jgi:hypothetical protein
MHRIRRLVLHLSLGIAAAGCVSSRGDADAATRTKVIEGVLARLQASYVFPEKAAEMSRAVRARLARGEYDGLALDEALADSLTAHLRAVSRDKHLRVVFLSEPVQEAAPQAEPSEEVLRRMQEELGEIRFGIENVEVLDGNVGLLDLRGFVPADVPGAKEAVAAAMDSLSRTDALIIDLRRNQGGDPGMVQLLASYLFGPKPVQLSSIYWRRGDRTEAFWTFRNLRGARYGPDRPVYVLTSSRTFSAAEAFAYDLKHLDRATIVGETTAGGAHPGDLEYVSNFFAVQVPRGRAINPVTGTNWEGTGVVPHVAAGPEAALQTAHVAALRSVLAATRGRERRAGLERLIQQAGAEQRGR